MPCQSTLIFAALVLLGVRQAVADFTLADFSDYPSCAQPILLATAPESCYYGDSTTAESQATNNCLCSDTAWLKLMASNIAGGCDCSTLDTSAGTTIANCDFTDTPSVLTTDQIIAAGGCGTKSSTSASSSVQPITTAGGRPGPSSSISILPSSSTSPSQSHNIPHGPTHTGSGGSNNGGNSAHSSGLSSGAKVGIGAGVGAVAGLALLGGLGFFFWARHRKNKERIPEISQSQVYFPKSSHV